MEIEGVRKRMITKEKARVRSVDQVFPAMRKGGGGEVIEDGTKKKKKKRRIGEESDAPDGALHAGRDSGRDFLGINAKSRKDWRRERLVGALSLGVDGSSENIGKSIREAILMFQSYEDKGKKPRRKKSNIPDESDQVLESNEMEINNATSSIGKSKGSRLDKVKRKKKKGLKLSGEVDSFKEKIGEHDEDEVHNISSGDEDCSKGMKKWVSEYYQRRPGLKELQQRIDEFIVAHETKLEQENKEREARAAEGGWTVVTHHKGRKKTTEAESGVVVGSVSQAAMEEKMAKTKRKEVGLDFYRFQRKEAQRNELVMLQSKFEQDKKRIQELRASRKFRPF